MGLWIQENTPDTYLTGVFAAGVTPYFSQRPSLDLLGLNDEVIAHTDVPDFGSGVTGHEKFNLDYVLTERRPELILVGGAAPIVFTEQTMKEYATKFPGLAPHDELIKDERTWQQYEMAAFYRDDRWYNFLVRKDIEDNLDLGWTESKGYLAGARTGEP